jgi:hypothetical protein
VLHQGRRGEMGRSDREREGEGGGACTELLHPLKPKGCMLRGRRMYFGVGNCVWRAGSNVLFVNTPVWGERLSLT